MKTAENIERLGNVLLPRKKRMNVDQAFLQNLTSNILKSFVYVYYKLDLVGGWLEKNWSTLKKGFYNFDIKKLAKATVNELFKREGVIKNKNKVKAVIDDAREFQNTIQEAGSFSNFLRSLKSMGDKEAIRQLTQRFSQVGEYTAEYYLHSIGY